MTELTVFLWFLSFMVWVIVIGIEMSYRGIEVKLPVVTPAWEWIKAGIERVFRIKR